MLRTEAIALTRFGVGCRRENASAYQTKHAGYNVHALEEVEVDGATPMLLICPECSHQYTSDGWRIVEGLLSRWCTEPGDIKAA